MKSRPRTRIRGATFVVMLALSGFGRPLFAETEPEPTPTVPTLERCRLFCAGMFDRTSKEYVECCDGCDDAEECNAACRGKFPNDGGRHGSCFKACMARGRAFEPPPTPALPQL